MDVEASERSPQITSYPADYGRSVGDVRGCNVGGGGWEPRRWGTERLGISWRTKSWEGWGKGDMGKITIKKNKGRKGGKERRQG